MSQVSSTPATTSPTTGTEAQPSTPPAEQQPNGGQPSSTGTELGSEPNSPSQEAPKETTTEGTELGAEPSKPADPATPADPAQPDPAPAGAEFRGAPEGDYSPPTLPDGLVMDTELFGQFSPLAKEIDLSQAGMQKLIDWYAGQQQDAAKGWSETVSGWRDSAKADADIGGAAYPETLRAANAAITKYGTPELRQVLNTYGLGNHPELIRFCRNVGAAMGEGTRDGGNPSPRELQQHERFYGPDKT